jgi:hypothetical protein
MRAVRTTNSVLKWECLKNRNIRVLKKIHTFRCFLCSVSIRQAPHGAQFIWRCVSSFTMCVCGSVHSCSVQPGHNTRSWYYKLSVWWPEDKNNPNVAHACRKRRLKWIPSVGIAGSPCLRVSQVRRRGPPGWGLGVGLTAPPRKNPGRLWPITGCHAKMMTLQFTLADESYTPFRTKESELGNT